MAIIAFTLMNSRFISPSNLSLITQQVAVVGTLAIGQTIIILTAGIDLSVGAIMVLSSLVMAKLATAAGLPGFLALLIGFATGALAGFLNGFLVTKVKLPPFIATLGTLSIFTALALLYSGGTTIRGSAMPGLLTWTGEPIKIGGFVITWGVLIMLVLYVFFGFILARTAWGRHVYAVGDDKEAARLAGISVNRVLLSVYIAAGLVFAITAWILIGRIDAASPNAGRRCQPRLDHRCRDRWHEPVRRPGNGVRHPPGRPHRRRLPQRALARRVRRPLPNPRGRHPRHPRGGGRPVDPEGACLT